MSSEITDREDRLATLTVDEAAHYGIEFYIYDREGELVSGSINTTEGSRVRGDVRADLILAYDDWSQDGDVITLTGRRLAGGGGYLLKKFVKIT